MRTRTFLLVFALFALMASAVEAQSPRGIVRGVVFVRGAEASAYVTVSQHQDLCGDKVPNRHLQVDGGRVANAVVALEYQGPTDFAKTTVTLENRRCDFEPTVQVAPPGATLVLRNNDPISHTMQLSHDGRPLGTVEVDAKREKKQSDVLAEPGLLEIQCEFHDWMYAKVMVLDHPYYAITSDDGSFAIALVPPGTYKLKVWHEKLGVLEQDVIIEGNETTRTSFTYR
jgi:plastocyanin